MAFILKYGILLSVAARIVSAEYALKTAYDSGNLFKDFHFFTENDPTHGYVDYQTFSEAQKLGLIESRSGRVARIKVDSTSVPADGARGRKSVRLESRVIFNHGLFIADIEHMPSSTCGLWPALWQVGPNWFRDGEVDILEGIHEATTNLVSLHTDGSEGSCNLVANEQKGYVASAECDNAITATTGCGVSSGPYGTPFNKQGGGIYAWEWTSKSIKVWYFPRAKIPKDISRGKPDPSSWGPAALSVGSKCNIDAHFRNMRMVINTTFCGSWAGIQAIWEQTKCFKSNPILHNTCINYVKNNPHAYKDAYWDFKSIKVYDVKPKVRQATTKKQSSRKLITAKVQVAGDSDLTRTPSVLAFVDPILSPPVSASSPIRAGSTKEIESPCPVAHNALIARDASYVIHDVAVLKPDNSTNNPFVGDQALNGSESGGIENGYLQASLGSRIDFVQSFTIALTLVGLGLCRGMIGL